MLITITGKAGEGKSTMAKLVQDALKDVGFTASLDDEELVIEWSDPAFQSQRLKRLRGHNLQITIKTINT